MRDILRLTEVDQVPPREIAIRLAEDPGTVATRAMRARRALSSAYLLQHVGIGGHRLPPGRGCDDTQAHIVSFLRGTAGSRRRARIEEHLATCAACRAECADLRRINGHLRSVAFAALAAVRTAGEAAWSHLAAVAAASAAPLAATGVLTATTLGPVVIVPPPSSVPAPPAVVEEAPLPPPLTGALHLPMGVAAEAAHPLVVGDTARDAPVPALDADTSVGRRLRRVTAAPAGPTIVEDVTVLPSVPTVAPPAAEDAAAEPATEPDSDISPSVAAGASPDPVTDTAVAVAPMAPPAEPSDDVAVATPEPPPPTTAAPPPEVAVTDPPALAPASSDDGGAATTVSRKGAPGKAAPADDGGGDSEDADVVTPARRGPTDVGRPLDAP
jgi:hypothetical protein